MIKIFKSPFSDEIAETHEFDGTVAQFMESQGVPRSDWHKHRSEVYVDGRLIPPKRFDYTPAKDAEIVIQPRGGVVDFIRKIDPRLNFLLKGSDIKQNQDQVQQGSWEESKVTANTAKPNEVVPELFGRYIKYPDYLTPPYRYYLNQEEQWIQFLCCIGPGRYVNDGKDVKIGETSFY